MRVSSTISGVASTYVWDRLAENPKLLDDGGKAYVHAFGNLAQIDGAGNRQYMLNDALGSLRGLADNSGGLVGSANYDVFGTIRAQTGVGSALGFAGELFSAQTGLLHLRARDYRPGLGRFLSADSVQPNAPGSQGFNLYAYVANNPTRWIDPSGHNTAGSYAGANVPAAVFALAAATIGAIVAINFLDKNSWLLPRVFETTAAALWVIVCYLSPACGSLATSMGGAIDVNGSKAPGVELPDVLDRPWGVPGVDFPTPVPATTPMPPWVVPPVEFPPMVIGTPRPPVQDPEPDKQPTPRPKPTCCEDGPPQDPPDDKDEPEESKLVLLVGGDGGEASVHVDEALNLGPVLHKLDGRHPDSWLRETKECKANYGSGSGKDCDEYPFGSTDEGGETNYRNGGVSLKVLNLSDNRRLGAYVGRFYGGCSVSVGEQFDVIVELTSPTMGFRTDGENFAPCYIAGGG